MTQILNAVLAFMLAITLIPISSTPAIAAENKGGESEPADVEEVTEEKAPAAQPSVQVQSEEPEAQEPQVQETPSSIEGLVWLDENEDGLKDPTEAVLPGVKLLLCTDTNEESAVTDVLTKEDGTYTFENVTSGTYYVAVASEEIYAENTYTVPATYSDTSDNKLEQTGFTQKIDVASSQEIKKVNAGLVAQAAEVEAEAVTEEESPEATEEDTEGEEDADSDANEDVTEEDDALRAEEPVLGLFEAEEDMDSGVTVQGEESVVPMAPGDYQVYDNTTNTYMGSYADLANASISGCAAANGSYTIYVMNDVPDETKNLQVTLNKTITLKSWGGGHYTITQKKSGTAGAGHASIQYGTLILEDITLKGNTDFDNVTVTSRQGGIAMNGANAYLIMKDGAHITECSFISGGGVQMVNNAKFTMEGGSITNCKAVCAVPTSPLSIGVGGGVSVAASYFTMKGGTISGNEAVGPSAYDYHSTGGGVAVWSYSVVAFEGGSITNNTAEYGGGISNSATSGTPTQAAPLEIHSGMSITGNTAHKNGGGIYVNSYDYSYANPVSTTKYMSCDIDAGANISGNTSYMTSFPPINYDDFTTRATKSFDGTLLDNDNINYRNPHPSIRYYANNSIGGVFYETTLFNAGDTATVRDFAATGLAAEAGYRLDYWSLDPSGTGTKYYPGDTFTINANTTLYAIYRLDTYDVIEKYHSDQVGTPINSVTYPDITNTFAKNATVTLADLSGKIKSIPGYTYTGYMVDGVYTADPTSAGPTISSITTDKTVVYVYSPILYTVTYSIQDRGTTPATIVAPTAETGKIWGSSFGTAAPIAPSGKVYVGWRTTPAGTIQTGNPSGTVNGNLTIYLVYGDDSNNNGTEDVKVTRHALGDDGTVSGVALTTNLTPVTKTVDLPATYADAENGVAEAGWTYAGWNTTGSPTTYTAGTPSVALTPGTDVDVYYVYTVSQYTVTEHYVDRSGTQLSADTTKTVSHNGTYTGSAPAITNFLYAGFQTTAPTPSSVSTVSGGATPTYSPVTGAMDIYIVYGQDSNNNGTEDINVTRHALGDDGTLSGVALTTNLTPVTVVVDLPATYTTAEAGVAETGWTYAGWNTTASPTTYTAGAPSITLVPGVDVDVYYVYGATPYTVTEHYVDRSGTQLSANTTKTVTHGGTYTGSAPAITNFLYAGFQLMAPTPALVSTVTGGATPTHTPVTGNMDIYIVYGQDSNNNGTEDVNVTRHALGDDGSLSGVALTTNLTPVTVVVDLPATYTTAEAGVAESGWTYAGWNTTASPVTYATGAPSITLTPGIDVDVYYVYTQTNYTVTYHLVDRADTAVTGLTVPTAQTNMHYGDTFGPVTPPSGTPILMTYVGFKIGLAGTLTAGNPTGTVTGNMDVYLLYGQDKGNDNDSTPTPDGIEDVTITKNWETAGGTTLAPSQTIYRNIPGPFTEVGGPIAGYNYRGYKVDGGALLTNIPNLTLIGGVDHTITYIYAGANQNITVKYVKNDGVTQLKANTTLQAPTGSTFTLPASYNTQTVGGVLYKMNDWSYNSGPWAGNTSVSFTMPPTNTTITLRYFQDANNNGVEDFTITERHENGLGNQLRSDTKVIVDKNDPYSGTADAGLLAAGYTYERFNIDGSPWTLGPTLPSIASVVNDHNVIFSYLPNDYLINVEYRYKDGTLLDTHTQMVTHATNFIAPVKTFAGKVQTHWTLDGANQGNTAVKLNNVVRYHNIVVWFGQDSNNNGVEDFTITEDFYCNEGCGATFVGSQNVIVDKGDIYLGVPKPIAHHVYASYKVGSGQMKTGSPTIANVRANASLSLYYNHATYSVKTTHVDTNGNNIGAGSHDTNASYKWQSNHTGTVPAIAGYSFSHWTLDGAKQTGSAPVLNTIDKNHNIQIVYTPNANPTPPPNHGNYSFVKSPNVKNVNPGDIVDYTFTNFGNGWGKTINNYSIADMPDKGLDFVSASMPAFTNGAGVTYDVVIHTDSNINGYVLHANVPADQPFSFNAPILASGEHIRVVTLEFGDVPAGFAVGDSLTMTFRVWDNPPAQTLGNKGILSYVVDGVPHQFVSSGDGTQVSLGGYFGTPKMGDHTGLMLFALGAMVLVSGGILISTRRRKQRDDV